MSKGIIRLAGTTCCPTRLTRTGRQAPNPLPKYRRLPGTITGKPGVRHLAGTVFADTSFA